LRRLCPDRANRIPSTCQGTEGRNSRLEIEASSGDEEKGLQEETPEPKDYGGSDYSDNRNPSSWAATGRDDSNLYYWKEVPKEPTPEGTNGGGDPNDGGDGDNNGDPIDDDPFGEHPICCASCSHAISDLFASIDECFQTMEVIRQRM
jgi:hypothetical protein